MREKKTRPATSSAAPHRIQINRTSLDQHGSVNKRTHIRGSGDRLWRPAG